MKVYGWLERAQIENLGADPTGGGLSTGRFWLRTDLSTFKFYNGAASKTLVTSGDIVNADINASAAIDGTKVSSDFGSQVVTTTGKGSVGYLESTAGIQRRNIGAVENFGMTLASGTFTLCQQSQSAFSASAPGYVTLPSSVTPGKSVTLKCTANVSFNDDSFSGTSDIAGVNFNTTAGVAYASDCPFYIYACNTDDTNAGLYFFIARVPWLRLSSGANEIAYKTVVNTDELTHVSFFLTSTNVKTAAASKPCILMGGFRMKKSSANDWTVQALSDSLSSAGDGIRQDIFNMIGFVFPVGQQNAGTASHFTTANAPTWASPAASNFFYRLDRSGMVHIWYSSKQAGNCTNGTNASQLGLALPFAPEAGGSTTFSIGAVGDYAASSASATSGFAAVGLFAQTPTAFLYENNALTTLKNNAFSSANDDISISFSYMGSLAAP